MAGLFSAPKPPPVVPVVNPADTQNRLNSAQAARLAAGGSNATSVSPGPAPTAGPRLPTLTGLN